MKLAILATAAAALIPAYAQTGSMKAAPAAGIVVTQEKAEVGLQVMGALEKEVDKRLSTTGATVALNDPCIVLGAGTRGYYIPGVGAVFTSEIDLVNTPPGAGLFSAPISAQQKTDYHKRKLARVPVLEQSMRDLVLGLAIAPSLKLGDSDKVVVAVRLVSTWEDTTGLPGQIVMRLDRKGDAVKMEVQ